MIKKLCVSFLMLFPASGLYSQSCGVPPGGHAMPDELVSCAGQTCKYPWYTSQVGSADCWGVGQCNPAFGQQYLDVGWYQAWSCADGNYVSVTGSTILYYGSGFDGSMSRSYPNGIESNGSAMVWVGYSFAPYFGYDQQSCDWPPDFSGPYAYFC